MRWTYQKGFFPLKYSFSRPLCCHMDPADRTVAPCLPSSYVSVSDNTRRSPNIYVRRKWTYSTTALIYVYHTCPFLYCGPGYLCRYSDSLRAGRSVDRNPVGASFSASIQTDPGTQPASYTMDTGSFPGVKRPFRGVDHLPHLAPRLKKEYSYSSTHPLGFLYCAHSSANFIMAQLINGRRICIFRSN
jgi:hypothetical protein